MTHVHVFPQCPSAAKATRLRLGRVIGRGGGTDEYHGHGAISEQILSPKVPTLAPVPSKSR